MQKLVKQSRDKVSQKCLARPRISWHRSKIAQDAVFQACKNVFVAFDIDIDVFEPCKYALKIVRLRGNTLCTASVRAEMSKYMGSRAAKPKSECWMKLPS